MSQYYLLGRFAMRWRKMRPIVTEVAWSVCVSVGGNLASHKTAKLTEMSACRADSFAVVTRPRLSFVSTYIPSLSPCSCRPQFDKFDSSSDTRPL